MNCEIIPLKIKYFFLSIQFCVTFSVANEIKNHSAICITCKIRIFIWILLMIGYINTKFDLEWENSAVAVWEKKPNKTKTLHWDTHKTFWKQ